MKRSVGAVCIGPDDRIKSVGYNGCPAGLTNCFDGGCNRCNSGQGQGQGLHECQCLHAEQAAILELGIKETKDCKLFSTLFPCVLCANMIVHAVSFTKKKSQNLYFH